MSDDRAKLHLNDEFQEWLKDQRFPDPDETGSTAGGKRGEPSIEDIRFDVTPEELIRYLKRFIVGQDHAIQVVATKICTHFHRMKLERTKTDLPRIVGHVKSNVLLIGPTGVGKTYLIRLIANKLNVPFVKGDATKFSETGYVGGDVEDLIREMVHQVDGNIKLAEYGIVYIDEIDKTASSRHWFGPDVSRSGVQRNLLKLMEETEVDMKVPHDLASQMEAMMETQRTGKAVRKKVNTRNILFVMSGSFTELPEIIAKRLKKGGMGFTGETITSNADIEYLITKLQPQDLIEYGFESEFVGRIPVVTYLNELTEDALFGILSNPSSAVIQSKKRDFAAYGIDLQFETDAMHYIAREAYTHRTGARGLVTVVERVLLPFERSLPSTGVDRLVITEKICRDPERYLEQIIKDKAFEIVMKSFAAETGIELEFSPGARRAALSIAAEKGMEVREFLEQALKDYGYGLKLVGKEKFTVTRTVLADPIKYLNNLVKKSYHSSPN